MVLQGLIQKIKYLESRFGEISDHRKALLKELSGFINSKIIQGIPANLVFICTHNSRRSHMSQIWARTAAEYYGILNINCYSGGTEATQFNSKAIKAVRDFGFIVKQKGDSGNPLFLIHFAEDKMPLECFSKIYDDAVNPKNNFAAVMTCSDADENCPVVLGADARFPITFKDPKEYDGTVLETQKYKERFEQIGIEMLFTFREVLQLSSE